MSLRIPIDYKKLTDSPYSRANQSFFNFSKADTHDFVHDLVHGNPTCYLISGYRGVGKSSFIKKLEEEAKGKSTNSLFVYLNFAKHEPKSILLRKLIRNFYLRLTDSENDSLYSGLETNQELKVPLEHFHELYDRTFFDVSKNSNIKNTKSQKTIWKIEANLAKIASVVCGFVAFVFLSSSLDLKVWQSYIVIILSAAFMTMPFLSLFDFSKVDEDHEEKTSENSRSQLYDDEIAEYSLIKVLSSLKDHVKVMFVLDELDKVSDDRLVEDLINELKPIMLSGLASFIVVAGQNLYYNYFSSHTKDDSPLSSLFAKDHHIPLLSPSEFRLLFKKTIRTDARDLSEEDSKLLDSFVSYLILSSKRIPRRFISLIRQNLVWTDDSAYLEISKSKEDLEIYSIVLQSVEDIQNQMINAEGYPSAISDYLSMQLLLELDTVIHNHNIPN
ncbi:ATP-binding protein [Chryseolinea lacunae]|uniref:ATP-binding protein n=1 Tax=Chryseolinea lacunae TaxID=2801331 RepID=A0ABS1KT74_9BACT|nr:ATP-binding protein [Chryseolinea lacunae]MBL0742631.1 ATP-binding protein [Chryseolinea lacunae]